MRSYRTTLSIGKHVISQDAPVYFIADVASNHDGDLARAKELIYLAKEAGADAVKFQHFLAEKIVSDVGFRKLGAQVGHQASWKKSVFEVYKDAECHRDWNEALWRTAREVGIEFMTTPYDVEAVDSIDPLVHAYKIGSGDITWTEFLTYVAHRGKPVLLATGASDMQDVERAVDAILAHHDEIILMQCNTNYTGSMENLRYVNLNVLKSYAKRYPDMLLGLSDHTPGHVTVLGAVALGAKVIEKHFTSENSRTGPDHAFSMNPVTWKEMVERTREMEAALGDGMKKLEENERETVVLQQRALRLTRNIKAGERIEREDLVALRPAPAGAYRPYEMESVVGKAVLHDMEREQALYRKDVNDE